MPYFEPIEQQGRKSSGQPPPKKQECQLGTRKFGEGKPVALVMCKAFLRYRIVLPSGFHSVAVPAFLRPCKTKSIWLDHYPCSVKSISIEDCCHSKLSCILLNEFLENGSGFKSHSEQKPESAQRFKCDIHSKIHQSPTAFWTTGLCIDVDSTVSSHYSTGVWACYDEDFPVNYFSNGPNDETQDEQLQCWVGDTMYRDHEALITLHSPVQYADFAPGR